MHLKIETKVKGEPSKIMAGFTRDLFEKLNPPFPKAHLMRYDGNKPGDEVHIKLNFLIFNQTWFSKITDFHESETSCYFIDEGTRLPFFLTRWKHKHIIQKLNEDNSKIIEDIEFESPLILLPFVYLGIVFQMKYRSPIYKRIFN